MWSLAFWKRGMEERSCPEGERKLSLRALHFSALVFVMLMS